MLRSDTKPIQDRIVLDSSLSEISKVYLWVEALAAQYEIVESVQFAINLCLEEALSNVIRHGYATQSEPGRSIAVLFTIPSEGNFLFTIEDDAPLFNPLQAPPLSKLDEQGEIRIGGHGIHLIHGFADSLEYESTATGNRFNIGFSNRVFPTSTK